MSTAAKLNLQRRHVQATARRVGRLARRELLPGRRALWPFAEEEFQWISYSFDRGAGHWICAFSDGIAGRWLPRHLESPDGRERWPVRSVRAPRPLAQAAARVSNQTLAGGVGTLAAIVSKAGHPEGLLALSAGHVMAGTGEASMRDTILVDGQFSAKLWNWMPVLGDLRPQTSIDAAVAELDAASARELMQRYPHLRATTTGELLFFDQPMSIQCAGQTLDAAYRGSYSGWVDVPEQIGEQDYWIEDGVTYQALGGITQPGDSGSALLDASGRIVGVHCAGAPNSEVNWNGLGCPIDAVFNLLGCAPLGRPPASPPSATIRTLVQAAAPAQAPRAGDGSPHSDVDVLARTLWGEARGEPDTHVAMSAVAHVVLNRLRKQTWWGRNITEVCRKRYQFSCWNPGDPNLTNLLALKRGEPLFEIAIDVAECAAAAPCRLSDDPTNGATHYYADTLRTVPSWAQGRSYCARIGHHLFFRDVP